MMYCRGLITIVGRSELMGWGEGVGLGTNFRIVHLYDTRRRRWRSKRWLIEIFSPARRFLSAVSLHPLL